MTVKHTITVDLVEITLDITPEGLHKYHKILPMMIKDLMEEKLDFHKNALDGKRRLDIRWYRWQISKVGRNQEDII